MSDKSLSNDISGMLQMLDDLDTSAAEATSPVRFVVATDWSDAAVPLATLKAFRAILQPDGPAQLTFAVPHEPTEADAACVHVLLEGAGTGSDMRGVEIVSFEQAADEPYDTAIVPEDDAGAMITQVAGLIVRMHDVARRLEAAGGRHAVPGEAGLNAGNAASLGARLARSSVSH